MSSPGYVVRLDNPRRSDADSVGGNSVSLGEMIEQLSRVGISVSGGSQGASGVMFTIDKESGFQQWLHLSRIAAEREAAAGANDMISTVSRAQ